MKGVVQMLAGNDILDCLTTEINEQTKKRNMWARRRNCPPAK